MTNSGEFTGWAWGASPGGVDASEDDVGKGVRFSGVGGGGGSAGQDRASGEECGVVLGEEAWTGEDCEIGAGEETLPDSASPDACRAVWA